MKNMQILTTMVGLVLFSIVANARIVTDAYDFKMSASIPRIYDNMESQGYRQYQTQSFQGVLCLTYDTNAEEARLQRPEIWFRSLTNKTWKIGKACIGYNCEVDIEGYMGVMPRAVWCGSNKTGKFNVPSIVFYVDADPDYNVGEDEPDNALLLTVAGKGQGKMMTEYEYVPSTKVSGSTVTVQKKKVVMRSYYLIYSLAGSVAGTLGCGCKAYGHTSPTRLAGVYGPMSEEDGGVTDVAPVWGTWSCTYNAKLSEREALPEPPEIGDDWTKSTSDAYPSKDGWLESTNSDGIPVAYYNKNTMQEVASEVAFNVFHPTENLFEYSFDKKYPSTLGFYQAMLSGDDVIFENAAGVRVVKVRSTYYYAPKDLRTMSDVLHYFFTQCYLLKTSSGYAVYCEGKCNKMYKSKDGIYSCNVFKEKVKEEHWVDITISYSPAKDTVMTEHTTGER